jgi:topoisomerase-4 subunit A
VKRFKIETNTLNNKFFFIKEGPENYLEAVTTDADPTLITKSGKGSQARTQKINLAELVEVTGWRAVGSKLVDYTKNIEIAWETREEEEGKQAELF